MRLILVYLVLALLAVAAAKLLSRRRDRARYRGRRDRVGRENAAHARLRAERSTDRPIIVLVSRANKGNWAAPIG